MDRKVLGRGLDALIPADAQGSKEKVQQIQITEVIPSKFQPRSTFNQAKIDELASSIQEKGIIQPVLVRAVDNGKYELIAGERRFRAAKQAGLTEIPAIVRRVADADLLEISIIENIQREELNALEEAKAYQRLATEFAFSQDTIAKKVGKDKSSVSNLLRLLNLETSVQEKLTQNLISFGHAKALLSLGDSKSQIAFCEKTIKDSLSVRQLEQLVSKRVNPRRSAQRVHSSKDADVAALEQKLQHKFGTKVKILQGRKRGKIEIEYYSLDDLDRVLKVIGV